MNLPHQLAQRFREVYLNGRWVALTNFKDQLDQTSWQQAIQKVGELNTIAALTFHVNYYLAGVIQVFEGGDLTIRDKYSFDMPEVKSEEDWKALKESLYASAAKFADHVEQMTQEQLEAVFVKEEYGNYYRSIEGMIEHGYYHLGQISIIRKMIAEAQ